MDKQLKSIKCPECGSTENTCVKEDCYRCKNCGTYYFLDNDDVTININHRFEQQASNQRSYRQIPPTKYTIFFIVLIGVVLLLALWPSSKEKYINPIQGNIALHLPISVDGKPYFLVLSDNSSYKFEDKAECFFNFINPDNGEVVKRIKANDISDVNSTETNFTRFSDGNTYIIVNKKRIYKISPSGFNIADVTKTMFEGDSLYTSGIVQIDSYMAKSHGEALKVMTTTGREYYYFPLTKQSYTQTTITSQDNNNSTLLSSARDSTIFAFTEDNKANEGYNCQLLKIVYKYNGGGPCRLPNPKWTGNEPPITFGTKRVVSYANLTPGHNYFNPYLLLFNNNSIFIWCSVNASPDSGWLLQSLDAQSGEVKWTIPFIEEKDKNRFKYFIDKTIFTDNKFVFQINDTEYIIVDGQGENLRRFNIYQLKTID